MPPPWPPVAADEAILTLPESPLLDVPPLRAIVPLTQAVPPLAVATSNEPLDVAVPEARESDAALARFNPQLQAPAAQ